MRTILATSAVVSLLTAATFGTAYAGDSSQRVPTSDKYRITAEEQTACASDASPPALRTTGTEASEACAARAASERYSMLPDSRSLS